MLSQKIQNHEKNLPWSCTNNAKQMFEIAADLYLPHKWHRQHDLAFAYMALRAHLALLLLHMAYADKPYR